MEIQEFIETFAEAIEVDDVDALSAETEFRELEEWSSLSIMLLIAFYNEQFDKQIGDADIKNCTTIHDLYNLSVA